MIYFKLKKITKLALSLSLLLCLYNFAIINNSYGDLNRIRQCNPDADSNIEKDVTIEGIDDVNSALSFFSLGKDFKLDTSNPYCAAQLISNYVTFKGSVIAMGKLCGVNVSPKPVAPIEDTKTVIMSSVKAPSDSTGKCALGVASSAASITSLISYLAVLKEISGDVFENIRICGSNWMKYNNRTLSKDLEGYKKYVGDWVNSEENSDKINSNPFNYKEYREWYFGGVERESSICKDVNKDGYPPQKYYYRGTQAAIFNCENYNVKGKGFWRDPLAENGILSTQRINDYKEAYDCCIQQKRKSICIEYKPLSPVVDSSARKDGDYFYRMCEAGKKCAIAGIVMEANYLHGDSMICASTYSLCPYNFNIGGGNLTCDRYSDPLLNKLKKDDIHKLNDIGQIDPNCKNADGSLKSDIRDGNCDLNHKAGKCKNFCQPYEHCVVVDNSEYNYVSEISSPYFSQACMNFVGDSRNRLNFDTGIVSGKQRHFSAPIAQCIKETVENVFFNRAGHTRCGNSSEYPNHLGKCNNDFYRYQEGEQVESREIGDNIEPNFFKRIQNNVRDIIRLILTLSVMLTGFKILGGNFDAIRHKEVIGYVLKIAFVIYFVMGDAWQTIFFNGVYKVSDTMSNVVFDITVSDKEEERDGCQFGSLTIGEDETQSQFTLAYPPGKEYLAIWDTMDCKIARYLAMGSDFSFANIAKLIFASFFTGTFGIWFAVFLSIFGVMMIVATIRMLHIFCLSAISIIIMVYLSIITIPTILFSKTKDIFQKWLGNLIGLSLQPIILFAFIGVFVSVFDHIMLGSATFDGVAPDKKMNCSKICIDKNGYKKEKDENQKISDICIFEDGDKVIDPTIDSVSCILTESVGNWPGFEAISISIPILKNIFIDPKKLSKQIISILKATLVIYILQLFISEIPAIASTLVGGATLKFMGSISVESIMKQAGGFAAGAAMRARRSGMAGAKKAIPKKDEDDKDDKDDDGGNKEKESDSDSKK